MLASCVWTSDYLLNNFNEIPSDCACLTNIVDTVVFMFTVSQRNCILRFPVLDKLNVTLKCDLYIIADPEISYCK